MEVTVGVILATLVVEAVGHLVANHHTDGTIIESSVGLGIEEGALQDACREADLIGGWIVVGVDGLRCHMPLVTVNGLAGLVGNPLVVRKEACGHHVLIEALGGIDGQLAVVSPFVGIANLDIELIQLLVGIGLGGVAHPRLGIDALSEADLQVVHQLFHHLLGLGGEVALAVHLAEGLAHGTLHLVSGALPQGIVFLAAAHSLAEEVEVGLTDVISQIRGTALDDIPLHDGPHIIGADQGQQLVETGEECRLPHVHLLDILRCNAPSLHVGFQGYVRIVLLKLGDGHLVVIGLWVT